MEKDNRSTRLLNTLRVENDFFFIRYKILSFYGCFKRNNYVSIQLLIYYPNRNMSVEEISNLYKNTSRGPRERFRPRREFVTQL
jgi:hypothetical protein